MLDVGRGRGWFPAAMIAVALLISTGSPIASAGGLVSQGVGIVGGLNGSDGHGGGAKIHVEVKPMWEVHAVSWGEREGSFGLYALYRIPLLDRLSLGVGGGYLDENPNVGSKWPLAADIRVRLFGDIHGHLTHHSSVGHDDSGAEYAGITLIKKF